MYNTTIIVCTKNIEKENLINLKALKKFPVIIVDKSSEKEVLKELKKYKNVKLVNQKKKGLANARNLGLRHVKTKFVLMLGSDNVLKDVRDIKKVINYMEQKNWVGAGFLTRVYRQETYFDKCMNFWWQNKITEGERKVVGTPIMYKTDILKKFKYDENVTHADDTVLGEKLHHAGYKQGYSNIIVYDVTENNFESVKERFGRYGKSDQEYHEQYCVFFKQKVKSFLHPFRTEWQGFKLWFLPFYFIITFIRFFGRLK